MENYKTHTKYKQIQWSLVVLLCLSFIVLNLNSSCKKTTLFSKGNLTFSRDTVVFDTVFTTIGSTTKQLKIYNKENKPVVISEVELMGGSNSPYRINLDGLQGTHFSEIELPEKDSLFLFVEVTLNPNGGNLPMVVEDSIRFKTNGKDQYVQLAAWGQDMYYHYSDMSGATNNLDTNEGVWPNDKPHLIYGAAFVDEGKQLTIQAGTKIYLHKQSFLFVYKGTLNIQGQLGDEVIIQGDRLESDYDDVAGQYYGVYFKEAKPSSINYAIIKNGTTGIHIEGDGNNGSIPTVTLSNTIIENHASYGILNYAGGKIYAENCVIAKNGVYGFINLAGKGFDFYQCTFASYATGQNQQSVIGISDYYNNQGTLLVTDINATMENCIIYGNKDDEITFNLDNVGTNNFAFNKCLIKKSTPSTEGYFTNIIWNQAPLFKSIEENNFELKATSPAINVGASTSILLDIKGNPRNGQPDLGAYEYQ
ncbi:MAG: right-handed parallel beta-helix repeat-containing protein [Crocinitomicaceae bacterium]|nr:right-handed parallel beta-helix repeat-containing protein [Crocinitomicaceae bacterium]